MEVGLRNGVSREEKKEQIPREKQNENRREEEGRNIVASIAYHRDTDLMVSQGPMCFSPSGASFLGRLPLLLENLSQQVQVIHARMEKQHLSPDISCESHRLALSCIHFGTIIGQGHWGGVPSLGTEE